jgi:D-glycero-D-manno-heptose 1,7-bisphosphate phosphatase
VVVATNQSGVTRGLFTLNTLNRIHEKMQRALAEVGASVDAIFYCPHAPEDRCNCRKPEPGLFHDIERRLGVSLRGVPAVGDSLRDLQAAAAVDAFPILVLTGKGRRTLDKLSATVDWPVFDDLAAAVDALLVAEDRP